MKTPEIENVLRSAPKPAAPAGLKDRLTAGVKLPSRSNLVSARVQIGWVGWLRRWWPALAPAAVSMVCAVVFAFQQAEIQQLKQTIESLSQPAGEPQPAPNTLPAQADTSAEVEAAQQQELARLRGVAAQLTAGIARLEQTRLDNQKLRTDLAQPPGLSPEDAAALAQARERAMNIACINNLKQLGLALKTWALDNNDKFPGQVLEMTNEMSTPKILVCPADPGHQVATDWASWSTANCSYEYLAPGGSDEDPMQVVFRCPVHGNIGLADGSVQGGVAKTHPERLVQRNGRLYLQDATIPSANSKSIPIPAGSTPADAQAEFMRRYGLKPGDVAPPNKQP